MKNADQPAFPHEGEWNGVDGNRKYKGMSKREYFAAHAPERPAHFYADFPEELQSLKMPSMNDYSHNWSPAALKWAKGLGANKREIELELAYSKPGNGPDSTIDRYIIVASDVQKQNGERQQARIAYEIRAWRYYYADMMLKEPEKEE